MHITVPNKKTTCRCGEAPVEQKQDAERLREWKQKMWKRFLVVSLAISIWMASGESRASDNIELTQDNVVSIWRNINEIIMVLSSNIALDDEWIAELRNLQPTDTNGGVPAEMAAFREKLNMLLASSDLTEIQAQADLNLQNLSTLYVRSGDLLDNLVYYLIDSDSLASVAIYYGGEDVHGAPDQEVVAQINLANQRLDAFIEENGL